jgi:hypothetical protein
MSENMAQKLGYVKVSEMKKDVVRTIKNYVFNGGFLFAMCTACDTYDITLSADNVDICDAAFDGDPVDPRANDKLNFANTFAFQNFTIYPNPMEREFSNINCKVDSRSLNPETDYFTLFEFSAK